MAFTGMGMDRVMSRFSSVFVRKSVHDDDAVDRLHHIASLILLLAFAGGSALMEYVGEPINCWTPQSYPQQHYTDHVNGYCWTHPLRYPTSAYHEVLASRRIINFGTAFYRWVTLIFVMQGVLFKFPNVVWNYLNGQSGASLRKLRDLLTQAQLDKDERHVKMDEAAHYVHSWLASPRIPTPTHLMARDAHSPGLENHSATTATTSNMSSTIELVEKTNGPPDSALKSARKLAWSHRARKLRCLSLDCGRSSGKYLSIVYLMVKMLYLLNVAGNFIVLSVFLDTSFWRYGYEVVRQVMDNGDWSDPVNFPRMLICDFRLYESGEAKEPVTTAAPSAGADDTDVHTVQCVVAINMVLEKLFVLQWFWLLALAWLTLFTFISWAVYTLCPCAPYLFARKYMKTLMYRARNDHDNDDSRSLGKFVKDYLKADGIFVLRMVEANMEHMVVKELVEHLWDNFQARTTSSGAALDKERTDEIEMMMMKEDDTIEEVLGEETELSADTPEKRANSDKEEIVCEA